MFDITPEDIENLDDAQLRTLVGLLCEAEVRRHGYSTCAVTWGGNQNAADGGIDVRVALPPDAVISGFVPRPATGVQVKKPDMQRHLILAEMCPSGTIRPVIADLADQCGAYIIVSSGSSTSGPMLDSRLNAMAEAISHLANRESLLLKFYDCGQMATWVRDHPGLILWVREAVGRTIKGWHSYGAWAFAPGGVNDEYILDEEVRIRTGKQEANENGISALEGIRRIRSLLEHPKQLVRLIGLSGVGKTRLVQALFDHRIGEHSLDPTLVFYTNLADGPDPHPTSLASNLIAARTRAIIVVDNCPPSLHQRLGELCRGAESTLSVITVEYDIRDDEPEGTEIFELNPSSIDLIKKLIVHRFPAISNVDVETIAEFSGGNARIAIALASAIGRNETISGLTDNELFHRLFQQTHAYDEPLLLAAQVCSLVYSFQGEDVSDGDDAELAKLGAMIGKSSHEMYRSVEKLYRRYMAQKRGVWRAILPHAIANRLAATALEEIPFDLIRSQLIDGRSERMFKSFSRRLGFLHDCQAAKAIVIGWLAADGLFENVGNLNPLGMAVFENIAPVAPEDALRALERAMAIAEAGELHQKFEPHITTIRKLAYDGPYFERCMAMLVTIAEAANNKERSNEAENVIVSLCHIILSGTHASIEQRMKVVRSLIQSDNQARRRIGFKALHALLEGWHFTTHYNFDFGARSRNYGYWPRNNTETRNWFGGVMKLVEELACSGEPNGSAARAKLAEQFRGLWTMVGAYSELEHACHAIARQRFWREGWIAVRQTLHFDSKGFAPEISARLSSLEDLLRPKDLVQKVRAIVLSNKMVGVDIDDFVYGDSHDPADSLAKLDSVARSLLTLRWPNSGRGRGDPTRSRATGSASDRPGPRPGSPARPSPDPSRRPARSWPSARASGRPRASRQG